MSDQTKKPQATVAWIENDTPFAASREEVQQAMESQLKAIAARWGIGLGDVAFDDKAFAASLTPGRLPRAGGDL